MTTDREKNWNRACPIYVSEELFQECFSRECPPDYSNCALCYQKGDNQICDEIGEDNDLKEIPGNIPRGIIRSHLRRIINPK